MISCSTCWNSSRHTDGASMIQEILDLGFDTVELGHGIRLSLVEGILKMVEAGKVKISSLHNFCPLPPEIPRASPDCYQFSAERSAERDRAIRNTLKTFDFAKRLGVDRVVMHLGSNPIGEYTDRLVRMAEVGLHTTKGFVTTKQEGVRKRQASAEACFARTLECMKYVYGAAAERGIRMGIESRHSFEEIPSEREMLAVLEKFPAPTAGYWHDFGHVQVKHNLGFLNHPEWLAKVSNRLIGCHLHDTKWPGRDHMAPFTGDIRYEELMPHVPKGTLMVFEMSPRRTAEEITTAFAKWKERYGEWL